jgi:glutathione S-transferase
MYKLYYSPGACSLAVHVILEELAVPFEAIRKSTKDGSLKTPEFLKLNPRGQVPTLEVDGKGLREGAAMIIYLCDEHKASFLPRSGWDRAQALQWIMWCNATLHPAYGRIFYLGRQTIAENVKSELIADAQANIQSLWDEVEDQLNKTKYLAGDSITAADIMLPVYANWLVAAQPKFGPKTKVLFNEITARPSYVKALQSEEIEFKAAA